MTGNDYNPALDSVSRRKIFAAAAVLGSVTGASVYGATALAGQSDDSSAYPPNSGHSDEASYMHKGELVANVKDYGARGDGETDDTQAINDLLARVGDNGLCQVFFPPGRYMHTGITITGKSDFEILGPGELVAATSTVTEYFRVDTCTNFKIQGIQSRHEKPTARRTTPARTFSITNCRGFEINACHAHMGEGVGIMLNHCSQAIVRGNRVHDTKADGIGLYGDTHHVTVLGNTTYETGDDGIAQVGVTNEGVRPHDISISGNTVGRSYARGIAIVGAYNTSVTANTVETTRAGGIYVAFEPTRSTYGCSNVVVSGNAVRNANTYDPVIDQAAIFVLGGEQHVEDITIADNRIFGARMDGIRVGGSATGTRRTVLMGNSVTETGAAGLQLGSVEDVSIIGNTFTDSGSSGILATSGLTGAVVVSGNTVRNSNMSRTDTAAIDIFDAKEATILVTANTVVSADRASYGIDVPAQAVVYGNNVEGYSVKGGVDGTTELYGNLSISASSAAADAGEGKGMVAIRNAVVPPRNPPKDGGVLYVHDGALKYRGSGGTVTTLGPA